MYCISYRTSFIAIFWITQSSAIFWITQICVQGAYSHVNSKRGVTSSAASLVMASELPLIGISNAAIVAAPLQSTLQAIWTPTVWAPNEIHTDNHQTCNRLSVARLSWEPIGVGSLWLIQVHGEASVQSFDGIGNSEPGDPKWKGFFGTQSHAHNPIKSLWRTLANSPSAGAPYKSSQPQRLQWHPNTNNKSASAPTEARESPPNRGALRISEPDGCQFRKSNSTRATLQKTASWQFVRHVANIWNAWSWTKEIWPTQSEIFEIWLVWTLAGWLVVEPCLGPAASGCPPAGHVWGLTGSEPEPTGPSHGLGQVSRELGGIMRW